MQSGVQYSECIQTELGCCQRADRVNSRVNCVSGGPYRDGTIPPGCHEAPLNTTAQSSSDRRTQNLHLRSPQPPTDSKSLQDRGYFQQAAGMKAKLQ